MDDGGRIALLDTQKIPESCVRSQSLGGAALSMVQMINVRTSPDRVTEVMSALTHGQQEKLSFTDMPHSLLGRVEETSKPATRVVEKDSIVSTENTTDTNGPRTDELAMSLSATELKRMELMTSLIERKPVQRTRLVFVISE